MNPVLRQRIHGGWLGKSIGGTLGLAAEGRRERQHFTFYDPVPTVAPPNDDLELQLVWLHLLETRGLHLTQRDFADGWLNHIHYMWDEYGRCRWNLRRGVPLSDNGTFENPFHAGMGSPIRSEIWACLCPGNPEAASCYAALDASLDHGAEGIAGEVYLARLQALVLGGRGVRDALPQALAGIRGETETARAIHQMHALHADGLETWECRDRLLAAHGHENFTHAPLNLGLIAWALLHGDGDFERTILLAVNGGYDTDCTAATVGATLGLCHGADAIPERWRRPIGDGVLIGKGILGIAAPQTLAELTERTAILADNRARRAPSPLPAPPEPSGRVELTGLPGTTAMAPADGGAPVPWANGELPEDAKRAGGATWNWEVGDHQGEAHILVCLARGGARLWIDDRVVIDCPRGAPYVLTPHRCAAVARAVFRPTLPRHRVRIELAARDAGQDAGVLLASGNLHLTNWTSERLPHQAKLPPVL